MLVAPSAGGMPPSPCKNCAPCLQSRFWFSRGMEARGLLMIFQLAHSPETGLIPRLLVGLVGRVCRFPRSVLAICLAGAALSAWMFFTRLEYRTQRSDLISPNKDYQQRWRQYLAEFGNDDDIVVVVQGTDRPRMQRALDALAAAVGRQPDRFDRLFYKVDLRNLQN